MPRSSTKQAVSCGLALSVAILGACMAPENSAAQRTDDPSPPTAEASEFREFNLEAIDQAAEALGRVIADPADKAIRLELASIYDDHGFAAASSFYRTTAHALGEEEKAFDARKSGVSWVYPVEEAELPGDRHFGRSMEVENLLYAGRYGEAIDLARSSAENAAYPPQLVVEWAYAWLFSAAAEPDRASENLLERETAIRTYLTAVEEAGALPAGMSDQYAAYEMLGKILFGLGDPVGSYVASKTALERLSESAAVESGEREEIREQLEDQVEAVQEEVRKLKGQSE